MEQKAEELYEDGWCTSHPKTKNILNFYEIEPRF